MAAVLPELKQTGPKYKKKKKVFTYKLCMLTINLPNSISFPLNYALVNVFRFIITALVVDRSTTNHLFYVLVMLYFQLVP
jgi:hypothetical protein